MRLLIVRSTTGLLLYTAAIEAGALAEEPTAIALVTTGEIPEVCPGPADHPSLSSLLERFDAVVDVNEVLSPFHPRDYAPAHRDRYRLASALASHAGEEIRSLVVPDLTTRPLSTVLDLFRHVPVTLIPDSLVAYGPASTVPTAEAARVTHVIHGVPGLPSPAWLAHAATEHLDSAALRSALPGPAALDGAATGMTVVFQDGRAGDSSARLLSPAHAAAALALGPTEGVAVALDSDVPPRHLPPLMEALSASLGGLPTVGVTGPRLALAAATTSGVVGSASLDLLIAADLGARVVAVAPSGTSHELEGSVRQDLPLLLQLQARAASAGAGRKPRRSLRRLVGAARRRLRTVGT